MKKVIVFNSILDQSYEAVLFSGISDFHSFKDFIDVECESAMKKMTQSPFHVQDFNNIEKDLRVFESLLVSHAIRRSLSNNVNPIFLLLECKDTYLNSLLKSLQNNNQVVMNKKGGFSTVKGKGKDEIKVVANQGDYIFQQLPEVNIKENTKILNIENSWNLESEALIYLKKNDSNFSFITEFYLLSEPDTIKYFKKFVANKGIQLYVYTTGLDTEQIKSYLNSAEIACIKEVVIEFSSAPPENTLNFITGYINEQKQKSNISLSIIDNH